MNEYVDAERRKEPSYLSKDQQLEKQTTDVAVVICWLKGLLSISLKQPPREGDIGRRNWRRGKT